MSRKLLPRRRAGARRGYVLLATAVAVFAIIAMTGLAVDLGRMYVARNECQTYVDAGAIAAALELDGTSDGLVRARQALAASPNRWNFGTAAFTNSQLEFAQTADGPWTASPAVAAGYAFARVTTAVNVPMAFIRVVAPGDTRRVGAWAVAGQVLRTSANQGTCPFSPFAHDGTAANYGLTLGGIYTLRWSSNPRVKVPKTLCPGDQSQAMIDKVRAAGSQVRGYIEDTSAAMIRQAIINDYQTYTRAIGDYVNLVGGQKQSMADALKARIYQDTEQSTPQFSSYRGNGRRILTCPVNDGVAGSNRIVGFASFFLQSPPNYDGNALEPLCAEYIGSNVAGTNHRAAVDTPGLYDVRLVK